MNVAQGALILRPCLHATPAQGFLGGVRPQHSGVRRECQHKGQWSAVSGRTLRGPDAGFMTRPMLRPSRHQTAPAIQHQLSLTSTSTNGATNQQPAHRLTAQSSQSHRTRSLFPDFTSPGGRQFPQPPARRTSLPAVRSAKRRSDGIARRRQGRGARGTGGGVRE